jgi:hypothetical protein
MPDKEKVTHTAWDFVEKYYPNYYSSDTIARADDLSKIINDEVDKGSDAEDLFINEFDENKEVAKQEYNRIHVEIYEDAIENFLNQTGGN